MSSAPIAGDPAGASWPRSETGFDHDLYRRFPVRKKRPDGELEALERIWQAPSGWARVTVVNNNYIGTFYIGAAFLFFLLAAPPPKSRP